MAQWQHGEVTSNGIKMHYTRTGDDKPPLVLAHGLTDNGLCWTPVAKQFEADYDVIMVDARGHGFSEAPLQGYDSATQAADLAGVITALGLEKPAIIGHSMGAATTIVMAGMYPDLAGAIVLEDPPPWWVSTGAENPQAAKQVAAMREQFYARKRKTRAELLAEQRVATPTWSEAELEPWADAKIQVHENVTAIYAPGLPRSVDWFTVLARVTCPALLVTADRSLGAIVSSEDAQALQALVPHLQTAHIAGAGHCIHREQFEPYMQAVRTFLSNAME